MKMSHHFELRCKQRSIDLDDILLIEEFGVRRRTAGGEILCFDKKSKACARYVLKSCRGGHDRLYNKYLVLSDDGTYITAGYRTRRLRRK